MLFSAAALLSFPLVAFALTVPAANGLARRAVAFVSPAEGGGSQLDNAGNGLGEPLNVCSPPGCVCQHNHFPLYFQVIISGLSSTAVLTDDGILNWARSIGLYIYLFIRKFINVTSMST